MFHKAVEDSAYTLSRTQVFAASCEMTRPTNTTQYGINDVWNNSNTYNPSPFVFQFPYELANETVHIARVICTINNVSGPNSLLFMLYNSVPAAIPLDNTPWNTVTPYFTDKSFNPSAVVMQFNGYTAGRYYWSLVGDYAPMKLSNDAKLYGQARIASVYTPLSGEVLFAKVIISRNVAVLF